MSPFSAILNSLDSSGDKVPRWLGHGQLRDANGMLTASLPAFVGEIVDIHSNHRRTLGEVIGFSGDRVQLMPFENEARFSVGDRVSGTGQTMLVPVGDGLLGRVIDATGRPIDDRGPLTSVVQQPISLAAPDALTRRPVDEIFETGQRAIDSLLTFGKGQRVGLFAGSGVGKSTLMGQIASGSEAAVNVVALIGERGREVLPFIKESLGEKGLRKSILIVATADQSSLMRVRAAETAVTIAQWFRQQRKDVFFLLDSITRFAMAQREMGLMLGEPPTSRGYTPSVFQKLGMLLEQLGNSDRGTITSLITVLVEGDDMNDPVADAARSILDGHVVLDRKLAHAGHFPAIDVLQSASRVFHDLADSEHFNQATEIRKSLARYLDVVELVQIGAYQPGLSPETDTAIQMYPIICKFLQQQLGESASFDTTRKQMNELLLSSRRPQGTGVNHAN
ncbi:MAG: FliI/YscN family ATPase [Planctomycetota bacterium]